MKTCSKCKVSKPLEEFSKDRQNKSGYRCSCKLCNKALQKEYQKEYHKEYKNTPQYKEYKKEYQNTPQYKEYQKEYNKNCQNTPQRKAYQNTPQYKIATRKHNLKRSFGMTQQEYTLLYNQQEGKCLGCDKHFPILSIDHCHQTNKIRGLLCQRCNLVIGNADDKVSTLRNLIEYIEHYRSIPLIAEVPHPRNSPEAQQR